MENIVFYGELEKALNNGLSLEEYNAINNFIKNKICTLSVPNELKELI